VGERFVETIVGLFMIAGIACLVVLAFKVSGLTTYTVANSYKITADFDNIGDLKPRAPVAIAGVRIGQVTNIDLDPKSYKAVVTMQIDADDDNIPVDSSASIVTAGLLGANYISISPGFEDNFMKNGGQIEETHPALMLETMIGQLLFNMGKDDKKEETDATNNS